MLRSLFPEREDGKGLKGTGDRFWEVDFARGVAIIMVVVYHLVFDLDNFAGYPVASTSGFWGIFADVSAFAFVFLAGVSLQISGARANVSSGGTLSMFSTHNRSGSLTLSIKRRNDSSATRCHRTQEPGHLSRSST